MTLVSFTPVVDGTSATAAGVNTPLSTIYNDYNGSITDANISASAAINGAKVADGSITPAKWTNPYLFSVSGSGTQSISAGASATVIMSVVAVDTNSNYNTSTGEYTVPVTGFYQINGVARLDTGTTAFIQVNIAINGATDVKLGSSTATTGQQALGGAKLISLTAGNKVTLVVYNSAGTGTIQQTNCSLSGFLVSKA